jgi:hypothetical protein
MTLTPEASVILEKWRRNEMRMHEAAILCNEMLRLFPPGHDAEITPERLIACGFAVEADCIVSGELGYYPADNTWFVDCQMMPKSTRPTNMGEVWSLMECCGIEVKPR